MVRAASTVRLGPVILAAAWLTPASAFGQEVIPPKIVTLSPGGVNMSDGSFTLSATDLSIGPLSVERFYKGGREPVRDPSDTNFPFFGLRMSHNFDIYIARRLRSVSAYSREYKPIVYMGNHASGPYKHALGSTIVSEMSDDSFAGSLAFDGTVYTYVTADGTIYTFNPNVSARGVANSHRISSIVYPNGRTQNFTYNSSNLLRLMVDSSGYALVFDYNSSGFATAACGFDLARTFVSSSTTCVSAPVKSTYSYTSEKLTGAVNAASEGTLYNWTSEYITCVKPAVATACKVTNQLSSRWQVGSQTFADGSVWNYQPNANATNTTNPEYVLFEEPNGGSSYTDPNGKVTSFTFVQTSPYSITDPLNRTTQYRFTGGRDYDSNNLDPPPPTDIHEGSTLVEATLPEGNKYLAEYAGPYLSVSKQTLVAKPGSGLPDRVVTYGYPSSCTGAYTRQNCTKPIWMRDSRSNATGGTYQTDYTYASHGGVLSELKPAPAAGKARPLKLTTWDTKSAYIKNSATGPLVPAAAIVVIASETQCQAVVGSNNPVCDAQAPQTVTTYEYGANATPDNLLLRGIAVTSGGTTLRTCYTYDALSNRISETSPNANLASCS